MKNKVLPYILSYLIVATLTAVYAHVMRGLYSQPPIRLPLTVVPVALNPGMTQTEFDARLKQVGLSEAEPHSVTTIRRAPFLTLAAHYVFDAAVFAAFAGLVILFKHTFPQDFPEQPHPV